jgi:predicted nucleotidyltransferase
MEAGSDSPLESKLLSEITRRLTVEFEPEQIWLFGSRAWGTPGEGSDVDLLIVLASSNESPARRAQRAHRSLSGIGVAKDVLVRTRSEIDQFKHLRSSLAAEILRRGRKIYG